MLVCDGEISPPLPLRPPSLPALPPPSTAVYVHEIMMQADVYLRFLFFPSCLFQIFSVCLSPWFAAAYNYPPLFPLLRTRPLWHFSPG